MKLQGNLHKMFSKAGNPVSYTLELGGQLITLNDWLGQQVRLEYLQEIECIHCGRQTKKSFNQGFCYPCFASLAQCDLCILSPEKCHFHLGTCREPEWAQSHCMRPHVIYLSNTSGVKIGITRETQVPTRWIDQGALQALPILQVSQRYHAGLVEHAGRLVTKEELRRNVWRTDYLTDTVLRVCVREIRSALGDSSNAPTYLETIRGRGYRFLDGRDVRHADAASTRLVVGRDREGRQLTEAFDRAAAGNRQLVILSG